MKRFTKKLIKSTTVFLAVSSCLLLSNCKGKTTSTTSTIIEDTGTSKTVVSVPTIDVKNSDFKSANITFFHGIDEEDKTTSTTKAYFKKVDDGICYVSIDEMMKNVSKAIEADDFFSTEIQNKKITTSFKHFNGETEYITLDTSTNIVKISSANYYTYLGDDEKVETTITSKIESNSFNRKEMSFDLDDYNLTSYYVDNTVLLPLSLFELIYTQELGYYFYYFNGSIYGDFNGINDYSGKIKDVVCSKEVRELTYNYLRLLFHKYYGLAQYKGLDTIEKVDEYLKDYKKDILSTNSRDYEQAESDIFNMLLDDPHSGYINRSIYSKGEDIEILDGAKNTLISDTIDVNTDIKAKNEVEEEDMLWYLGDDGFNHYCGFVVGNTAFIDFDEFNLNFDKTTGAEPSFIDDGDVFSIMYYAIKCIRDLNLSSQVIKNIVLDLSLNTGGYVNAAYECLSFMTNDPIIHNYEYAGTKQYGSTKVLVDNDLDGDFTDNDAAVEFNWFIQTSVVSFSCGNLVPFIAKDYGFATIIGQTSGGGMCVVGGGVLPDGSFFQKSDVLMRNVSRAEMNGQTYRSCEEGVLPDIQLENLYDYKKTVELINKK